MDNDQEKEEELFYRYTPEKEDITLYIILVKYFTDNKKEKNISLNKYSDDYCSLYDIRHYRSYHTFKKTETLYDIQKRIGFPENKWYCDIIIIINSVLKLFILIMYRILFK